MHGSGSGKVRVDASWSELAGKCITILRQKYCPDSSDDDDDNAVITDNEDDDDDETRQSRAGDVIRSAGLGRSYTSISLNAYNIISSAASTGC